MFVDGAALRIVPVEHQSAGDIAVVRDGDHVNAVGAGPVEISPEILGLVGIGGREGQRRVIGIEDYVAVQIVFSSCKGRPFIGNESGEGARFVVVVGGSDFLVPR